MNVITVGNTKGGVGKTCLAFNLAAIATHKGLRVWLIDADAQGTASTAMAARIETGAPLWASAHYPDAKTLRAQIQIQRGHFDLIVIDAGGRDSAALRAALSVSSTLLIPFQPRSIDIWALNDIAALAQEIQDCGHQLKALACLNMADSQGTDNAAASDAVADLPNIHLLPGIVGRRKAIANAIGAGLAAFESKPVDAKASAEFEILFNSLMEASIAS